VYPAAVVTFSLGNGAAIYRPDFFEVPTDFWLNMYWLLLCGTLIYLLLFGSRALLFSATTPSRLGNVYLAASAAGVLACSCDHPAFVTPVPTLEAALWCGSSRACAAPARARVGAFVANQDEMVHQSHALGGTPKSP